MSQDHAAQSDVVKKGVLKYKSSKVKGTSGASVQGQGPKSAKPLFVVFRVVNAVDKVLHVYSNDKKYHEAENPKYRVYVQDAKSVYFLSDRRSFCISFGDGGLLFFDASSEVEAEEWVKCFNAVLFAKGLGGENTLQYEVEMLPNSILNYSGAAVLELRDHDLIIWKADWDEVVRWRLNRLRSLKAKKNNLTILAGSRSVTGLGEFIFKSKHSIQITYAFETVVAKVKYTASPVPTSHSPPGEKSQPASTIPTTIPDMRDPLTSQTLNVSGGSVMANIPDFAPPGVYDVPDEMGEDYGKLDRPMGNNVRPNKLGFSETVGDPSGYGKTQHFREKSPRNTTPERQVPPLLSPHSGPHNGECTPEAYGRLDRGSRLKSPRASPPMGRTTRTSPPRSNPPPIKPSRPGYEDIDKEFALEEEHKKKEPPIKPSRPGYEDIDKEFAPQEEHRKMENKNHPPIKPSRPGYEDIDKEFALEANEEHKKIKKTHNPPIKPSRPGYEDIDNEFALDGREEHRKPEKLSMNSPLPPPPQPKSPIMGKRLPPPKPAPYNSDSKAPHQVPSPPLQGEEYGKLNAPFQEGYGQLNHPHPPAVREMYGHLDHTPPKHVTDQDDYDVVDDGVAVHPEQYKKLSHTHFSSPSEDDYGKLEDQTSLHPNRDKFSGGPSSSVQKHEVVDRQELLQAQARMKERHTVHGSRQDAVESGEQYGKLNHEKDSRMQPKKEQAPTPLPRQSSLNLQYSSSARSTLTSPSPLETYGHLEKTGAPTRPSFDPYGTLPQDAKNRKISSSASECSEDSVARFGDKIEEESSTPIPSFKQTSSGQSSGTTSSTPVYSTVNKISKRSPQGQRSNKSPPRGGPPPGYENTKPLDLTAAQQVATSAKTDVPPVVPPRAGAEKAKLRYENVGEDGKVLLHRQPLEDANVTNHVDHKPVAVENNDVEDAGSEKNSEHSPGGVQKPTLAPKPKVKPKPKPKQRS